MSDTIAPSILTLPVELVYRILDYLDNFNILCSIRGVCTRVNTIVDTYHRCQVNFFFILVSNFHPPSKFYRFTQYDISLSCLLLLISNSKTEKNGFYALL